MDESLDDQKKRLEQYAKEHGLDIVINNKLSREELEAQAIEEVCACRYYDPQDTLQETPDEDSYLIINHTNKCEICGQ